MVAGAMAKEALIQMNSSWASRSRTMSGMAIDRVVALRFTVKANGQRLGNKDEPETRQLGRRCVGAVKPALGRYGGYGLCKRSGPYLLMII